MFQFREVTIIWEWAEEKLRTEEIKENCY